MTTKYSWGQSKPTYKELEKRFENERVISRLFIVISILLLIFSFCMSLSRFSLIEENQELKDGLGDFMMYMVNVTSYCAELNNMTTNELLEGYLESEMERVLEDFAKWGTGE